VIELARRLDRREARVVLLGPRDDTATAETIVEAMGVGATGVASLVGRDRAGTLPALLSELDVVVAGDTGVAHLAAALGTPVVTLFGPTDPALSAPRGPGLFLRHAVPCSPCFYRRCPIEHPCMRGLTAAEVAKQVLAVTRARVPR
jgi:heptosyltransferase-2